MKISDEILSAITTYKEKPQDIGFPDSILVISMSEELRALRKVVETAERLIEAWQDVVAHSKQNMDPKAEEGYFLSSREYSQRFSSAAIVADNAISEYRSAMEEE